MPLTPEHVQLFRHNGFIKLPTRLSGETVSQLKDAIWKDIREEIEPVVRDSTGQVVRISNIWGRSPIFRDVLVSPAVLDPLECVLGPNIELTKNRHNHATLRLAGETSAASVSLHRDVLQWSRTILSVIFYLEETMLENGCTHVVPGTHLLSSPSKTSAIFDQIVPVPMSAGGMLAIDSTLYHGVGINRTDGTRMSMTVGYHSVDELSGGDQPKRVLVRGERLYMGNDG